MGQAVIRKIPQRKCIGCGEKKAKSELIRIVRTPDRTVILDATGKKSGRGAYLCRCAACLKKARKGRRAEAALECEIPSELYDSLEADMEILCR